MPGKVPRTDGVARDAVGTELLFENAIVRVWQMKLAPGEASPVHRHFSDYIIAYVDPLDAEILRDDETSHTRYERGYVAYFPVRSSGSELQRLTNVGGETHTHFVIELLAQNKLAPQSSNGREGAA